jgi:hypothetical protein
LNRTIKGKKTIKGRTIAGRTIKKTRRVNERIFIRKMTIITLF